MTFHIKYIHPRHFQQLISQSFQINFSDVHASQFFVEKLNVISHQQTNQNNIYTCIQLTRLRTIPK